MSLLSNTAIEFRNAFKIPNSLSGRTRQKNLIVEEFKEFLEADQNMVLMHPQDREATLKELADLIYVCAQYAENMNWDIEQALRRVHAPICPNLVKTANRSTERTEKSSKDQTINHQICLILFNV